MVIDGDNSGKQLYARHSTPNLSVEPPVATLVSLDEDRKANDASNDVSEYYQNSVLEQF